MPSQAAYRLQALQYIQTDSDASIIDSVGPCRWLHKGLHPWRGPQPTSSGSHSLPHCVFLTGYPANKMTQRILRTFGSLLGGERRVQRGPLRLGQEGLSPRERAIRHGFHSTLELMKYFQMAASSRCQSLLRRGQTPSGRSKSRQNLGAAAVTPKRRHAKMTTSTE